MYLLLLCCCVNIVDKRTQVIQIFLADGTNGRTDQPKVVQEVLADLKRERKKWVTFAYGPPPPLSVSLTVKYLFFTTSLSDLVNFPRKLCLKLS